MIIGNGDIARAIEDAESCAHTFLACGASNRKGPITFEDFKRERDMILTYQKFSIVYFSTLSIYYSHSSYTEYKREIENIIRSNCQNYTIVRIGNITWGDNPNTLINHLRKDQSRIDDTFRYLVTKEELNHWLKLIYVQGKNEMNIPGERVKVSEIVRRINNKEL